MAHSGRAAMLAAFLILRCVWPVQAVARPADDITPVDTVTQALADNLRERLALEPPRSILGGTVQPFAATWPQAHADRFLDAPGTRAPISSGQGSFHWKCNRTCKYVSAVALAASLALALVLWASDVR